MSDPSSKHEPSEIISASGLRLPVFEGATPPAPAMGEAIPESAGLEPVGEPADGQREGIVLRVGEALLDDVDRGIVRLDPYDMSRLHVEAGDVVVLAGRRETAARALPTPHPFWGRRMAQMDGMLRENSQAGLDERVIARRIEAQPARTVLLSPTAPGQFGPEAVREIRTALDRIAVTAGDRVRVTVWSRAGTLFAVVGTEPEGVVVIGGYTDIRIQEASGRRERTFTTKYEDVGGLEEELLRVRELVELPMKFPEVFARLRIDPPKGILLYGSPGSGKTLIARAVASEVKAHFIHLNGPEIIHKFYGESEAKLREVFEEAQREAPSIIFLDELDAIAPKRRDVAGDVEKRVVAQLLALMDGLVSRGNVVVIGATNAPELLDPALRRPGRFDREIPINVPNQNGRLKILRIHARGMPLADDVNLEMLAEVTHGFTGADLAMLCKEAGMRALQDVLASDDLPEVTSEELARRAGVEMRHFLEAFRAIEPSATRELFIERPTTRWDEIGGLDHIRHLLRSLVWLPRAEPGLFRETGIRPPRGVLLSGPPGTGKSLVARALAAETGYSFLTADAATILSKWVGESEKCLREVFRKARLTAPCIVLFDELEALVPVRRGGAADSSVSDRLVTQFLHELDNLTDYQEVLVLGATNRIDLVDPAALRPGRFDLVIELRLPDRAQRLAILSVHTRRLPLAPDVDLAEIADRSAGLSGSDIAGICQRAGLAAIRVAAGHQTESGSARVAVTCAQFESALADVLAARDISSLAESA